jgi:hypothetical protein
MGHRRIIDSKIRKSETFAALTYRQRDLWQGLIEVADDQGRLPGKPAYIRSIIWSYDDISLSEVEADLSVLDQAKNIYRYQLGDCHYIQIINWWNYQDSQWAAPSDFPAPEGWIDRARYHAKGNILLETNWKLKGGFIASKNDKISKQDSKEDNKEDSQQDTVLTCRDVNDDVKDDVNDEVKVDAVATTPTPQTQIQDEPCLSPLSTAFVNATQIPELTGGPPRWIAALETMQKAGVEPIDVTQAVQELRDRDYSITTLGSIVNAAISVMSKRKTGGKKKHPDGCECDTCLRAYAAWEDA